VGSPEEFIVSFTLELKNIAAKLYIILMMNSTAYGCKWQQYPTVLQFAICQADDV
jgi:hypothetical protein